MYVCFSLGVGGRVSPFTTVLSIPVSFPVLLIIPYCPDTGALFPGFKGVFAISYLLSDDVLLCNNYSIIDTKYKHFLDMFYLVTTVSKSLLIVLGTFPKTGGGVRVSPDGEPTHTRAASRLANLGYPQFFLARNYMLTLLTVLTLRQSCAIVR